MQDAIRIAFERGYTVTEDGILISPLGNKLKISISGKQRYPTFSVSKIPNVTNKYGVFGIPVHKFAAFCFYGENVFSANCVRHLNGNVLDVSKNNISLGTRSQNNLDKDSEVRVSAAKKARAAQGKRPTNAKFTDEQVVYIRSTDIKDKDLAVEYNVTRQAIWRIRKGKNYNDVTQ